MNLKTLMLAAAVMLGTGAGVAYAGEGGAPAPNAFTTYIERQPMPVYGSATVQQTQTNHAYVTQQRSATSLFRPSEAAG